MPNYNEKINMASSSEVVVSFLLELRNMDKPRADEEFETIRYVKRDACGLRCVDIEPWDEAYYTAMMKSSTYNLDSAGYVPIFCQVRAFYFFIPQCIEDLKLLVKPSFGAKFDSVPMAPGESWHSDVLNMCLRHSVEVCKQMVERCSIVWIRIFML